MYASERHERIATLVRDEGRASVADLSRLFEVTQETIRRDLDSLEQLGRVRRVHGGAISPTRAGSVEPTVKERRGRAPEAKRRIARAALRLIPVTSSTSVVLDGGTTVSALAEELLSWRPAGDDAQLSVITNSLTAAAVLVGNDRVDLTLLGGRLRTITNAAVGAAAVHTLDTLRTDIAFLGTNGLSAGHGLSTPDEGEAAVKSAMVHGARRAVVLADGTKSDVEALVRFATFDEIDTLITDVAPAGELAVALQLAGVEVIVA